MYQQADTNSFDAHVMTIATRLVNAIQRIFTVLDPVPSRPADLCKIKGINKDLASKLMKGMNQSDPFAALYFLPGLEALHSFMRMVNRKTLKKEITTDLKVAISAYQDLIRSLPDGQASLNAVISSRLPELKIKDETRNKQSVYKGIANLKGITADLQLTTWLILPDNRSSKLNLALINGWSNLKRTHPDAQSLNWITGFSGFTHQQKHFDGTPLTRHNTLLKSADCISAEQITLSGKGPIVHYQLPLDKLKLFANHSLLTASSFPLHIDRYKQPKSQHHNTVNTYINLPVKKLVFDVLIHESIWPEQYPEIRTVDSIFTDDSQNSTLSFLPLSERMNPIAPGIQNLRLASLADYPEIIRSICLKMNWNPDLFICYRSTIQYPVYNSEIQAAFPVKPQDSKIQTYQPTLF